MRRRLHPPEFVRPLAPCNVPLRRCPTTPDQASHRILILRLGAHGDIVMGSPLLASLRRAWPDAHLTWVTERPSRGAIEASPYIDEVLLWDGTYWKQMLRLGLHPLWLLRSLAFRRELRRRRYDIFISLQPEEWPLLVRGVGAPTAVGIFDTFRRFYQAKRSSRHTRLYTHAYAYPDLPPHRIDQYLMTLQALGLPPATNKQMSVGFTEEDAEFVARFLEAQGVVAGERVAVLAPMTTWPSKCWPAERYAALGDRLARDSGQRVVLIGSAKEQEAVAGVAGQMTAPAIAAAGTFTFRQMVALVARAALVVSGDTGPMHVAAALKTPYLALFGSTSAQWYGPLTGPGRCLSHPVPCGPCDQKFCPVRGEGHLFCQRLITVAEAYAAAQELLGVSASV